MPNHPFSFKFSDTFLDVASASKNDFANVFQYSFHGGDNQQWKFIETDDGFVNIINKHSNKALDIEGWKQEDCANLQQYEFHGGNNQKWKLKSVST